MPWVTKKIYELLLLTPSFLLLAPPKTPGQSYRSIQFNHIPPSPKFGPEFFGALDKPKKNNVFIIIEILFVFIFLVAKFINNSFIIKII